MSREVTQPNPLRAPTETLRTSERVVLVTGDMELEMPRPAGSFGGSLMHMEQYPLTNIATFTVVSRDRLRFHVQLEHKWEEWADPRTWNAYLLIDHGIERHVPEAVESSGSQAVTHMWDYEVRSVSRDASGAIVDVHQDGHLNRQTLGSLSLYRGHGDFVFYHRDIFTPETRWVSLILARRGLTYQFTWRFDDGPQPMIATASVTRTEPGLELGARVAVAAAPHARD